MAKARNKVIEGDYKNSPVFAMFGGLEISVGFKSLKLNKDTVEEYEVIDQEKNKSAGSTILKAGIGNLLLGPIGLLAGVAGKQKGIYLIAIAFKDGKRSLLEVDEKVYKSLIAKMF
jgi:hypothetical protein